MVTAVPKGKNQASKGCLVIFFGIFLTAGLGVLCAALSQNMGSGWVASAFGALFSLPFIAIGAGGIWWALRNAPGGTVSPEAQAAKAAATGGSRLSLQIAASLGTQATGAVPGVVPWLPPVQTEPGQTLPVRLPRGRTELAAGGCLLVFALFWNGFVLFGLTDILKSGFSYMALFMVPFVLVGLGLFIFALHQLLAGGGGGETVVEVSNAEVAPGETFEVLVSQGGSKFFRKLSLHLICEERATYQQGTSTRTDTFQVREMPLAELEAVQPSAAQPLILRAKVVIPADAMHSFKSAHNELAWQLRVTGDIRWWPNFKRQYGLLVLPRAKS